MFQPYFKKDRDEFKEYHLCKGVGKSAGVARYVHGLDDRAIYRCYTRGYATKEEVVALAKQGKFAREEGSPESANSSKADNDENNAEGLFGEEREATPPPGPAGRTRSAGPATRLRSLGNGIGNLIRIKRTFTRKQFNSQPKPRERLPSLRALRRKPRTPEQKAPSPNRATRKARPRTPSPKKGAEGASLKHVVVGEARGPVESFSARGRVKNIAGAYQEYIAKLKEEAARSPVSSLKKGGPSAP
jgi:hypothetical protein